MLAIDEASSGVPVRITWFSLAFRYVAILNRRMSRARADTLTYKTSDWVGYKAGDALCPPSRKSAIDLKSAADAHSITLPAASIFLTVQ
jgi:hypothetical protein